MTTTKKTDEQLNDEAIERAKNKLMQVPATSPAAVPVALIRFVKPMQVPGMAVTPQLATHTAKNRRRWDIELVPQLRSFRITYTPPDNGEVRVLMVHETRIDNWDPAL